MPYITILFSFTARKENVKYVNVCNTKKKDSIEFILDEIECLVNMIVDSAIYK